MPANFQAAKQTVNSIIVNFSPSFEVFLNLMVSNYHSQAMIGLDPFGHPPVSTNVGALQSAISSAFKLAESAVAGTGWEAGAGSIIVSGLTSYWMGAMFVMGLGPGIAPNIPLSNVVVSGGTASPLIYTSTEGQVVGNLVNTVQSMFWDIATNHKLTIAGLYAYLQFVPSPTGGLYVPMVAPWVCVT